MEYTVYSSQGDPESAWQRPEPAPTHALGFHLINGLIHLETRSLVGDAAQMLSACTQTALGGSPTQTGIGGSDLESSNARGHP